MNSKYKINLRETLSKNLKRLIGNSEIEAKELAAFDIIMDRREFLKAAQLTVVGALVASVYPPSAWGRFDKKLHVPPKAVGLTAGDMASVSQATQLVSGTELFQDTIYAQPVVAPETVNSHALLEGARGRLRLQSDLESANPDEFLFLDAGYHYGPTELVQLEGNDNDGWELVHYHYPWNARSDGARTDGLVRQVIMTGDDGLVSPTKVITVTGSATNQYSSGSPDQINTISYLVFVEDIASGNPGHLAIGTGLANIPPPYKDLPLYPVRWKSIPLDVHHITAHDGYRFADKYSNNGFKYPVEFDPIQATEHIVLYFDDSLVIISDADADQLYQEYIFLIVSHLPLPAGAPNSRLVHINWNPVGSQSLTDVVLASSQHNSDGSQTYTIYATSEHNISGLDPFPIAVNIDEQKYAWNNNWYEETFTVDAATTQNGALTLDYTSVKSVHSLFYLTSSSVRHLKLANFEGRGIVAFDINEDLGARSDGSSAFHLAGHFPLAFPDAAGLGKILTFSGGTSKFNGLRYVAFDADGNTFLLRQRRYTGVDSPYAPPIWGNYTAEGQPIQSISSESAPLPSGTSSTSNLHQLADWIDASVSQPGKKYVENYNFLLYTALAFATDDSSRSQAVWLGNVYKAAYAPSRFALDSEHVVIKQVQSGETDIYAAYTVIKNPIDKTWHQRQIATQILPQGPGLQESGDHYQATVTPANTYGKTVSLLSNDNSNLLIEVRADSPCTVIDDTNNLYYDIDRYTSFMAAPDPATGRLCLLIKAETFSQVLYVRLVDTSGLQPSNDAAMLGATSETVYAWQSLNLALQAQQRMGNGASPSALLGDNMPLVDTTVYVSGTTLGDSNPNTPWKGGYSPTTDNLGNLATYLNTSGQNLISATGQLSLGASVDGVTIDPLYAVTSVPSDSSRTGPTIQFDYSSGSVYKNPPGITAVAGDLGSIFSSISHALHDALHWLQHVEGSVYKDLSDGGVYIISDVDSITVKVKQDIMKQVNGVEADLNEVVSTVEEYASVVANLVVTVVESTFLYKFIETIITLISLFLHFGDILKLSGSFKGLFDDILSGANGKSIPSISSTFSSWDTVGTYLGPNNTFSQAFGGVDSSNVGTELIQGLLDAITGNPLTKKILNKVMSATSSVLNEVLPPLPLSFDMNQSAAQGIMDDITNLVDNIEQGVANMTEQTATTLIEVLAASAANPQQTYQNLGSGLGTLSEEIAADVLTPIFDFVDAVTTDAPAYAKDMIDYDAYITLNIAVLADLCKLFGIGSVSNTKLTLHASDAVFFPLALIAWVAVYMKEGRSISHVSDLDATFSTPPGTVGAASPTLWNLVRLGVDGVLTELLGISWLLNALIQKNDSEPSTIQKVFIGLGAWFNWIRWMSDFVYTCQNWNPATGKPLDYANVAIRLTTASADVAFTLPGLNLNPGTGWPSSPRPTDMSQVINTLVTLGIMAYDTVLIAESSPNTNQIIAIAGQDFARSQAIATFIYNLFSASASAKDNLIYFAAYILTCPIGFEMQVFALSGVLSSPGGPGTNPPGKHRRRRRRPHEYDSKRRRRRFEKKKNWWGRIR